MEISRRNITENFVVDEVIFKLFFFSMLKDKMMWKIALTNCEWRSYLVNLWCNDTTISLNTYFQSKQREIPKVLEYLFFSHCFLQPKWHFLNVFYSEIFKIMIDAEKQILGIEEIGKGRIHLKTRKKTHNKKIFMFSVMQIL